MTPDLKDQTVLIVGRGSGLARAIALAYDLPQPPSARELERISGNWRPYRTWATLLLRTFLEDQTGEISGRQSTLGHSTASRPGTDFRVLTPVPGLPRNRTCWPAR